MMGELKPWAKFKIDNDLLLVTSGVEEPHEIANRICRTEIRLHDQAIKDGLAEMGYALVPLEPTDAMKKAGAEYMNKDGCLITKNARDFYKAMIQASEGVELWK